MFSESSVIWSVCTVATERAFHLIVAGRIEFRCVIGSSKECFFEFLTTFSKSMQFYMGAYHCAEYCGRNYIFGGVYYLQIEGYIIII